MGYADTITKGREDEVTLQNNYSEREQAEFLLRDMWAHPLDQTPSLNSVIPDELKSQISGTDFEVFEDDNLRSVIKLKVGNMKSADVARLIETLESHCNEVRLDDYPVEYIKRSGEVHIPLGALKTQEYKNEAAIELLQDKFKEAGLDTRLLQSGFPIRFELSGLTFDELPSFGTGKIKALDCLSAEDRASATLFSRLASSPMHDIYRSSSIINRGRIGSSVHIYRNDEDKGTVEIKLQSEHLDYGRVHQLQGISVEGIVERQKEEVFR